MRTHDKIVFIALLILATFALACGLILVLSSPHSFRMDVIGAYYIVVAIIGYAFSFVVAKANRK